MFSMLLTDSLLSALRLSLTPTLSLRLSLKPLFLLLCDLNMITVLGEINEIAAKRSKSEFSEHKHTLDGVRFPEYIR